MGASEPKCSKCGFSLTCKFRWLRHFRRPREGPPRDLWGGVLGDPGESRGALPGTSGERGWGALRGSPGELSLGPRGRRFGSSEGVPGGAQNGVQMESQSGIPQDLENVDFDKELVTFSPLPDSPATPTATVRNSPKNVVHLPPTSRQNRGSGGGPYTTKQPGHPTPTTRR